MTAHLYAVEFGGGQIKVGRSVDAPARIATHLRAAIRAGGTVSRLHVEPCAAAVPAEAALIAKCVQHASARDGRELFCGLTFESVKAWLKECASMTFHCPDTSVHSAMRVLGGTPVLMASAVGSGVKRQNVEQWLKAGRVPATHAPLVEAATRLAGAAVHCEDLCPGVRWDVLRLNSRTPEPAKV